MCPSLPSADAISVNVVPEACSIEIDRRLVPGERPEALDGESADAFRQLPTRDVPGLRKLVDHGMQRREHEDVCPRVEAGIPLLKLVQDFVREL